MLGQKITTGWRKVKDPWCNACKKARPSEVHHIIARADYGGNEEENLIDLCSFCHEYAPNGHEEIIEYCEAGGAWGELVSAGATTALLLLKKRKTLKLKDLQSYSFIEKMTKSTLKFLQLNRRMHVITGEKIKKREEAWEKRKVCKFCKKTKRRALYQKTRSGRLAYNRYGSFCLKKAQNLGFYSSTWTSDPKYDHEFVHKYEIQNQLP